MPDCKFFYAKILDTVINAPLLFVSSTAALGLLPQPPTSPRSCRSDRSHTKPPPHSRRSDRSHTKPSPRSRRGCRKAARSHSPNFSDRKNPDLAGRLSAAKPPESSPQINRFPQGIIPQQTLMIPIGNIPNAHPFPGVSLRSTPRLHKDDALRATHPL